MVTQVRLPAVFEIATRQTGAMQTRHELTGRSPSVADRRLGLAVGLDVFAIVLFVAIGRRNHDESSALVAVLETAAPFLLGLAVAWTVVRAWRRPTKVVTGLAIWPIAVLVGMIVRNLVFGDGAAASFVVVATCFLGACLVGWRLAFSIVERRRSS
jgi:uncharacterized membrane protein (GlpM family)